MHNFVIGNLDHSRFGFEVACWHLKKAFLKALGAIKTKKPSKKAFFKCQQATSNPNLDWSKFPMTKLCILF